MRKGMGWAAAALVATAGCTGKATFTTDASMDEHQGENAVCAECKVTGGGQIILGTDSVQFAVNAIPESGPNAGPGFGGTGVAAKGKVQFQVVPSGGAGPDIRGDVDTIVSCGRTDGVLTATISGTLDGDGRFTVVVTDGGEPAQDTIAFTDGESFAPVSVENGNIQVHGLDRCEPPACPEECVCPDTRECEVCGPFNLGSVAAGSDGQTRCETPPPCPEQCACPELPPCEPCAPQDPPLPPPPPPPPFIPL